MLRRFLFGTIIILLAAIIFMGGYVLGQLNVTPGLISRLNLGGAESIGEDFDPLLETIRYVQNEYVDQPLDDQALVKGAIDGLLAQLDDPNTQYLPPEMERSARQLLDGNFEGIGVEVTFEDGNVVVVAPYEGSPAAEAGLQPGDILLEADGVSLDGLNASEAAALIRGPANTSVKLGVERDGERFDVEVDRAMIQIPSVRGELLDGDIAYVRLSRFGTTTAKELKDTLKDLLARNPDGMILDLRTNPGGSLAAAVDVADQILDEGIILTERFGDGREQVYRSGAEGLAQNLPLVVLIDEGSASASEVLAGAIHDRGRGLLIGNTSFGKGTVQSWKELSNGGGLRLTVARWLTPDGSWVHGEGLMPDVEVQIDENATNSDEDPQLTAAIDRLQQMMAGSLPANDN